MEEHAWQREIEELTEMEARARTVLGVKPGVPHEELRSAYRRVARECHPDVKPGDARAQERFKDALAAYRLLTDGTRDRRLLKKDGTRTVPDESGYDLDNSWGYFLWWRERFF